MRPYYTITEQDINKRFLKVFGKTWSLSDLCGHIMSIDVGKRIYLVKNILQIENQEQFENRLKEEVTS